MGYFQSHPPEPAVRWRIRQASPLWLSREIAARRRRETRTGQHIPIVDMTAHAMLGDRERCLESGMDFYVSKSINPMELTAFLSGVKTQWIAGGSPQAGV